MTVTVNGVAPTPTQKQDFRDAFEVPSDGELSAAIVSERSATAALSNKTLTNPVINNPSYTGTLTGGTGVVNLGSGQFVKDASGNVGIGTASPTYKIDTRGPAGTGWQIYEESTGTNKRLIVTQEAATVKYNATYSSAGNAHTWANGGTDQMMLDVAGNLGIGTASPISGAGLTIGNDGSGSAVVKQSFSTVTTERGFTSMNGGTGEMRHSAGFAGYGGFHTFYANGAEVGRFDAAGNFGIGVTPSAWNGDFKAIQVGLMGNLYGRVGVSPTMGLTMNVYRAASGDWIYKESGAAACRFDLDSGGFYWLTAPSGTAGNPISFTQAMTLGSSGNLLVGTTSGAFGGKAVVQQTVSASNTVSVWNSDTSGDNSLIGFYTDGGSGRGSITYNRGGGLTAYNTTSDYRAKTIKGPVNNPGATIDAFQVYVGQMHGATIERPMLVAHEAQVVAPYAVTGQKDAVDDGGKPIYQQVDHASLVPLLIAEIQSLRARLAILEAKQ